MVHGNERPIHWKDFADHRSQVYRHLLFNRLGREDDRFNVSSGKSSIIELSDQAAAIDHPPWHAVAAIRCLPDLGPNRESNAFFASATFVSATSSTPLPIGTRRSYKRHGSWTEQNCYVK